MSSVTRSTWLAAALYTGLVLGSCRTADKREAEAEASALRAPSPTDAQPSATTCGSSGSPDCPLQHWMKATLQTYQRARDYEHLSRAFHELAEHAPEGYADWQTQAEHGAELAEQHDADAIKHACKACHDAHRSRYRRERRAAALWE